MENSAGTGGTIGRSIDELATIYDRLDRHPDLGWLEAVHADAHARRAELAYDLTQGGEWHARRAPDVDHVRAARLEIARGGADLLARQLRRVVDLGEDLDVVGAVVGRGRGLAEIPGNLAEVLRPLFHGHPVALAQEAGLAFDQPREQHQVRAGGHLEEAGDPRRRHQRGDRDFEHRHLSLEGRLHLLEDAAKRRLGEPSRDEQNPGRGGLGIH